MDKHISIDINVSKLLEWLISRRHCTNDWQSEVVKIRAKINSAIQDMPENRDIVTLLSGTYIHYFHCLKIIAILKETEADSKNIFGSYTSQRMKDWQSIVSMYTKNNVYLAEAGELLHNTVKFEIPSLKKQITKLHQLENDYKKKEVDAIKSSSSAKNELSSLLKELGIESATSNYRGSLLGKANQLNEMNAQVASESKALLPALNHYVEFTKFSVPHHTVDLGLINYLSEKGNTTTYEFQNGVCPTRVELPQSAAEDSSQAGGGDVDGIDWGFEVDTTACQIEVVEAGECENDADGRSTSAADPNEIVATGNLALSVLDNSATRTNLTNQLKELQTFLKLRLYESDKEGTVDSIVESKQALGDMLAKVEEILDLLTSTTALHYYNILYSPKYLDDILQKIEQKEKTIERSAAIVAMSKERAKECAQEAVALNKKAQVIVKKSKELQNEVCKDISQRYNGRKVKNLQIKMTRLHPTGLLFIGTYKSFGLRNSAFTYELYQE
ncbi:hypothetical protein GE061_012608 [Apolygus lucorum]|uniref:Uncharacterized protein n=1 Tax=Apolygus lucorum TaxID=248454 RepID=A0A6A4K1M4_APOLU|nr:hypothetical protein GE061_012608 [Apolygus lucorum]